MLGQPHRHADVSILYSHFRRVFSIVMSVCISTHVPFKHEISSPCTEWSLPRAQELLTILTPVFPDAPTLSLLRNQLRTFATFADIASFSAWLLVTPADSAEALTKFLDAELNSLPPALDELVRPLERTSSALSPTARSAHSANRPEHFMSLLQQTA